MPTTKGFTAAAADSCLVELGSSQLAFPASEVATAVSTACSTKLAPVGMLFTLTPWNQIFWKWRRQYVGYLQTGQKLHLYINRAKMRRWASNMIKFEFLETAPNPVARSSELERWCKIMPSISHPWSDESISYLLVALISNKPNSKQIEPLEYDQTTFRFSYHFDGRGQFSISLIRFEVAARSGTAGCDLYLVRYRSYIHETRCWLTGRHDSCLSPHVHL